MPLGELPTDLLEVIDSTDEFSEKRIRVSRSGDVSSGVDQAAGDGLEIACDFDLTLFLVDSYGGSSRWDVFSEQSDQ